MSKLEELISIISRKQQQKMVAGSRLSNKFLSKTEKFYDSLARLIAGHPGITCIALCFDEDEILVSCGDEKRSSNRHILKTFQILKKYINNEIKFSEVKDFFYENCYNNILKQKNITKLFALESKLDNTLSTLSILPSLEMSEKELGQLLQELNYNILKFSSEIGEFLDKAEQRIKENYIYAIELANECTEKYKKIVKELKKESENRNISSEKILEEFVNNNKLLKPLITIKPKLYEFRKPKTDLKRLKENLDNNTHFRESIKVKNVNIINSNGIHAEMVIIGYICDKIANKVTVNKVNEKLNIGISKLACVPCEETITQFNESQSLIKIMIRGTHGKAYEKWKEPEFLNRIYLSAKVERSLLEKFDRGELTECKMGIEMADSDTSASVPSSVSSSPLKTKRATDEGSNGIEITMGVMGLSLEDYYSHFPELGEKGINST